MIGHLPDCFVSFVKISLEKRANSGHLSIMRDTRIVILTYRLKTISTKVIISSCLAESKFLAVQFFCLFLEKRQKIMRYPRHSRAKSAACSYNFPPKFSRHFKRAWAALSGFSPSGLSSVSFILSRFVSLYSLLHRISLMNFSNYSWIFSCILVRVF